MKVSYTDRMFCQGESVYLRQVQLKDAPLVSGWKKDPLVRRMALGPDAKISLASQRDDIRRALGSESELYLLIVLKEAREPIGYVRINWLDERKQFAWLRFALGRHRGKGYARDALRSLFVCLFRQGVRRFEAETYEFNHDSLRLLKGLGFKQEGLKRKAHFDGQGYFDVLVLGLLAEDFYSK